MRHLEILEEIKSGMPPLEQSRNCSLLEHQQAGPYGWLSPDVQMSLLKPNQCIRSGTKPSSHRPWGTFPASSLSAPCPSASFLTPASSLSSWQNEEQVAADWKTAIYLPLIKVFLENEHFWGLIFLKTNDNMVLLSKPLFSLTHTYNTVIQKKPKPCMRQEQ